MDFESAADFADRRAAIDGAMARRDPEPSQAGEVLTPLGHFNQLYARTEDLLGISGYHGGGAIEVTGKTETGVSVGVKLTLNNSLTPGPPSESRTLTAQWFDRGQTMGVREFASDKTADGMPHNPHVIRDLELLEESVTAAAELVKAAKAAENLKAIKIETFHPF